jgi:hypothetical protein
MPRLAALAALAGVATLASAAPAAAQIIPYPRDPSATPIAKAMAPNPNLVRRAVFSAIPPSSRPAAVAYTRLAGFPTSGRGYGILSTGNASNASRPNNSPNLGSESRGPSIRGARDVVIMRVDLNVPRGHNCLSFDFKFLSEEYPEFLGDIFNDAFIAELGISDWDASSKTDPSISAPRNFARDTQGNPIRINRAGVATMRAEHARGTTYDGATRRLRASTRVQPGLRRLYLSIFDQGDRIYDSAVFLDNLRTSRAKECRTGVRAAS